MDKILNYFYNDVQSSFISITENIGMETVLNSVSGTGAAFLFWGKVAVVFSFAALIFYAAIVAFAG